MSHDGASVPQYLCRLQAGATDFRADKLQPVSRCRVHDLRKSGLRAWQRSMAWLFREAGIAQVEFERKAFIRRPPKADQTRRCWWRRTNLVGLNRRHGGGVRGCWGM